MNFFRKVFRSKKNRGRSHTNPAGHDTKNGHGYGDLRMSRDDTFLQAPPRFPAANTSNRPMSAPSSPHGQAPPYPDFRNSRYGNGNGNGNGSGSGNGNARPMSHYHNGRPLAADLPERVLLNIFAFVCPHSTDTSYQSAEETTTEGGCMLCDMRDLATCGLVSRRWHAAAERAQYMSIRLDSVHYCGLEEALQNRRKRGSFFQKKQDGPVEVPELRMRMLYRALQENETIANTVQYIKMPYMTRETCKADLARLVSLTPALRYADVPEGVFSDDVTCSALRSTLLARCPELRKMTWTGAGAERNWVDLWKESPWPQLEVVTVANMQIEDQDLLRSLRSLNSLQDLTLRSLPWLSDGAFDPGATPFPPLSRLTLESIDTVSLSGLCAYLSRPIVSASLTHLRLHTTSITPQSLHSILNILPALHTLSYKTTVARSLPHPPPAPLASHSLRTLKFLITPDPSAASAGRSPADSHYTYLTASLPSLPSLTALYSRDPQTHQRLADLSPPLQRREALTLHEKAADHQDWSRYILSPTLPSSPTSSSSPGRKADIKPIWDMPRNSLVASGEVQTGFLKAAAAGALFGDDVLVPPSPGFAGGRPVSRGSLGEGGGGGRKHERSGSWASLSSLKVPGGDGMGRKEKRGSRQDLWR